MKNENKVYILVTLFMILITLGVAWLFNCDANRALTTIF